MENHPNPEELFEFPSDYMFKAFGPNDPSFIEAVHRAVDSVISTPLDALRVRPSARKSYVCVSVLVRLQNFDQVRDGYAALRKVEGLKYLL